MPLTLFAVGMVIAGEKTDIKPADKTEETMDEKKAIEKSRESKEPEIFTKESGIKYQDLVVGEGKECVDRMRLECHYTLWLADNTGMVKRQRLQSSKDGGRPFQCQIGVQLIQGWSDGMRGMKEGGTRRLYIPWELGYGERGMGAMIPGKSNLIFEIDFIRAL